MSTHTLPHVGYIPAGIGSNGLTGSILNVASWLATACLACAAAEPAAEPTTADISREIEKERKPQSSITQRWMDCREISTIASSGFYMTFALFIMLICTDRFLGN